MKVTNRGRSKMNRKTAAIISLSLVLVLTVAVGILSLTGMKLDSRGLYRLLPWVPSPGNWPESISLGLDLKGGVYVEYEATLSPEQQAEGADYAALMESTQQVMVQRLTDKGFAEATVTQIGNTGIRVEIPDVTDPAAVLELVYITFKVFPLMRNHFCKSVKARNATQSTIQVRLWVCRTM